MAGVIPENPRKQFLYTTADSVSPLAQGRVYTYLAGTTTPAVTYQDASLETANSNPIILDARGECVIYGSPIAYKFVVQNRLGETIYTQDNVLSNFSSVVDAALAAAVEEVEAAGESFVNQASGFASDASGFADDAEDSAAAAALSEANALTYSQISIAAANPYDTIADGLAGTADGDPFLVVPNVTDGLTRPTYFRDVSGSEVFLFDVPTGEEAELSTQVLAGYEKNIDIGSFATGITPVTGTSLTVDFSRTDGIRSPRAGTANTIDLWGTVAGTISLIAAQDNGDGTVTVINSYSTSIVLGAQTYTISGGLACPANTLWFVYSTGGGAGRVAGKAGSGLFVAGLLSGSNVAYSGASTQPYLFVSYDYEDVVYDTVKADVNALDARIDNLNASVPLPNNSPAYAVVDAYARLLKSDPTSGVLPFTGEEIDRQRFEDQTLQNDLPVQSIPVFFRSNTSLGSLSGSASGVREPAIAYCGNGIFVAICEGRIGSGNDDAPRNLLMKRSTDFGATWSAETLFCTSTGLQADGSTKQNQLLQPCMGYTSQDGRLHLVFQWRRADAAEGTPGYTTLVPFTRMYYVYSDDSGENWFGDGGDPFALGSQPEDAEDLTSLFPADRPQNFPGPNNLAVCADGAVVCAAWCYIDGFSGATRGINLFKLTAGTWSLLGQSPAMGVGNTVYYTTPSECCPAELPDGRIYVTYRDDRAWNTDPEQPELPLYRGIMTFEADGTFIEWHPDTQLPAYPAAGSVITIGGRVIHANVHGPSDDPRAANNQGRFLTVRISYQNGDDNTWVASFSPYPMRRNRGIDTLGTRRRPTVLASNPRYCTLVALSDTEFGILFEYVEYFPDRSASNFNSIVFLKFNLGNFTNWKQVT